MIRKIFATNGSSLLLLIVMLVLIILFSHTRYLAIVEARETLELEQQALAAEQLQLLQLRELKQLGPIFLQRLELFHKLIPDKVTHYEIELYIHELAYRNRTPQFHISFSEEESFENYKELPFSLDLEEGTFYEILDFIQGLRQGERVFRIDSLDLYPNNGGSSKLNAYLQISTFSRN